MTPERAAVEQRTKVRQQLETYARAHAKLPALCRTAHALGWNKSEIARFAGIGRSSVDRYLGASQTSGPASPQESPPGAGSLPSSPVRRTK